MMPGAPARRVLVAGAGIGGLAAALALSRAGCAVQVVEQAARISEVGAGIQLGPNAVRRLAAWGLGDALRAVAAFPQALRVRDARTHALLGTLRLGERAVARHGQAYATIHRADLQQMLLDAVEREPAARITLGQRVTGLEQDEDHVRLQGEGFTHEGEALVVADGVWSTLRRAVADEAAPRRSGHVALRTLLDVSALPSDVEADCVSAWLGPRMHAVAYPVRAGQAFNLVVIVEEGERLRLDAQTDPWNGPITADAVMATVPDASPALRALMQRAGEWKYWALHGRAPVASARELAHGRVALLGDAAHPMFPYLAQGAAMAIEDAAELGRLFADGARPIPDALRDYAGLRWQRVARVQARAMRNGRIFHASGPLRAGRDLAMRALGERVLDLPWLYGG